MTDPLSEIAKPVGDVVKRIAGPLADEIVLASVLSYVAYKASVAYGAILLFFYGVGSGVPVVLVGTTAGKITTKLERAGYGLWTERISGTALLALGLFLLWRA